MSKKLYRLHSHYLVIAVVLSLSCIQLFHDPMDCSPPGSSVHGISQAKIPEEVVISFCRKSSQPRDRICVSCIGTWIIYHWAPGKPIQHSGISLLRVRLIVMDIKLNKTRPFLPPRFNYITTNTTTHIFLYPRYSFLFTESIVLLTARTVFIYYIVHGTLQARILEWVAFPFSRGSYQPRDRTQGSPTLQADSLPVEPQR